MMRQAVLVAAACLIAAPYPMAQGVPFDEADCDRRYEGWSELVQDYMVTWAAFPEVIGGHEAYATRLRYPAEAEEQGVEGAVFVWLIVDEEGEPHCLRALSDGLAPGGHPLLEAEALRAAREVEYRPAEYRGRRWAQWFTLVARFRLE